MPVARNAGLDVSLDGVAIFVALTDVGIGGLVGLGSRGCHCGSHGRWGWEFWCVVDLLAVALFSVAQEAGNDKAV